MQKIRKNIDITIAKGSGAMNWAVDNGRDDKCDFPGLDELT